MRDAIVKHVFEKKVIAIVRGVYGEDCQYLTQALLEGGIGLMEFTFDQKNPDLWKKTCENISEVCRRFGKDMICGAGTVMNVEQVKIAGEAGAGFIVSPNVKKEVIEESIRRNMVSMPGALTPSEIVDAADYGADFVKVFPAANLGSAYIKALCSPLNHIPLLVVGGVNAENIGEFLKAGAVGAGLGGDLVNRKWIEEKRFGRIRDTARMIVTNSRGDETS